MNESPQEHIPLLYQRTINLPPALGDWTTLNAATLTAATTSRVRGWVRGRIHERDLIQFHEAHYRFGDTQAVHLHKALAVSLELHSVRLTQFRYQDLGGILPEGCIATRIAFPNIDSQAQLFLDLPLYHALVNRSLGSPLGTSSPGNPPDVTDMENTTLQTVFQSLLTSLFAAWGEGTTGQSLSAFTLFSRKSDPTLSPSEPFTLVEIALLLGETTLGKLYFGYPLHCLKKLLASTPANETTLSLSALPSTLLKNVMVPVTAKLGETSISTRELFELKVGDVIQLEKRIGESCLVTIADNVTLPSQPGISRGQQAVKISILPPSESAPPSPPAESPTPPPKPAEPEETLEEDNDPFSDETDEMEKEESDDDDDDLLDF